MFGHVYHLQKNNAQLITWPFLMIQSVSFTSDWLDNADHLLYYPQMSILFSCFFCSVISVSKKRNIETMLTLPYSYNWLKFTNKMNEKRCQEYQSMDPKYVTWQINSGIMELLYGAYYDFCNVSKILIYFSLIKHFPEDSKRHSIQEQVSILHRVGPIKVYLTIYESLKNRYLKKVFIPQINIFV